MRLSIVLLAIILFLFGLARFGAVSLSSHLIGILEIVDAVLLILEPVVPVLTIPLHGRRVE